MNNEKQHQDAYDPDRVVRKDVTDLQIEFGKIQSDIKHLEKNTVTNVEFEKWKVEFANWKLETVKWVVQLSVPVFAVLVGFLLHKFFGS